MPIFLPRIVHSCCSLIVVSVTSFKRTLPSAIRAFSGSNPIKASAVILLPQPDSPTRHKVFPRSREKLARRTRVNPSRETVKLQTSSTLLPRYFHKEPLMYSRNKERFLNIEVSKKRGMGEIPLPHARTSYTSKIFFNSASRKPTTDFSPPGSTRVGKDPRGLYERSFSSSALRSAP